MFFVWPKVVHFSPFEFIELSFFLENSPAIIFIDEIDAIATKRFDAQTGGSIFSFSSFQSQLFSRYLADREVQRILLELLNQMDGFDQSINVKVRLFCNDRKLFSYANDLGDHGHESC